MFNNNHQMSLSNKILYIGSGLHLNPLKQFNLTNEFIFVDTQPRSEFDSPNSFSELFYRKNFYHELMILTNKYGFTFEKIEELNFSYFKNICDSQQLDKFEFSKNMNDSFPNINPSLLTFYNSNTKQKLKYYISTNILYNMCEELENDIKTCDGLIISGYHPNKKILNYINYPINLYCYDETCYNILEENIDDTNNIVYWLFDNLDCVNIFFSNIFLIGYNNNNISKYDNIEQLDRDIKKKHHYFLKNNH